ncbi:galectin-8-like [Diretmus argenteus]
MDRKKASEPRGGYLQDNTLPVVFRVVGSSSTREMLVVVLMLAIPYAGTILGGLVPGEMVLIQGFVPRDADRFQVDFTCGSSVKPRADVAFHFNPRFKCLPCIVCNTLQKERWGKEEILYQMPFAQGAEFEIVVLVQKDVFKVAVDGAHVLEYRHRLDLDLVDTLAVSGKVKVQAIGFLPGPVSSSLQLQHL